jgi:hypothetical protein
METNQTKPTCKGSLQWPKFSKYTASFWCEHCGHAFDRNQLQGRDDHMPPHFDLMAIARAAG